MYKPQEAAQQKLKAEKTAFTQKVLEEQKQVREEMIKREEEKKEQLLRRIKYGKLVKDLYKPKINSALRLSREELDDKSKRNTSQSHKGFKKIFNQQNKNTTQCSSPDKNFVDDNQQEPQENFQIQQNSFEKEQKQQQVPLKKYKIRKPKVFKNLVEDIQPDESQKQKFENYLVDLKKKREDQEKRTG